MKVLGLSCFYHDAAAALVQDGKILAAAQEERFTRIKHDPSFPTRAASACLKMAKMDWGDLDAVVYYDKPWLKFERILETYYALAPRGASSFRAGLPVWVKEKAMLPQLLRTEITKLAGKKIARRLPLKFSSHHLSHAASAYYPSPFTSAAVLTMDGVGEWATTTMGHGQGRELTLIREQHFPHSLGLLYSAFTQYCGFKVNSGEYKLMGLAPYGRNGSPEVENFKKLILNEMCQFHTDGSIWLNQDYFRYTTGLEMVADEHWQKLFTLPARVPETPLTQVYADMALAIQQVAEESVLRLAKSVRELTGEKNLCLAGGVALNCVANGRLKREKIFDGLWIQPASGDAGGALGAALGYDFAANGNLGKTDEIDGMRGAYLGPAYDDETIQQVLSENQVNARRMTEETLCTEAASLLAQGCVVGWFQGHMEFGPRALGNRSILADPRSPEMQKKLNLKIKYRESFRPFAPSVLEEEAGKLFVEGWVSPYMLLVEDVRPELRKPWPAQSESWDLHQRLAHPRSSLPAITHLDFSARVQTVSAHTNPLYHRLISAFKNQTGVGAVVNTSFNVRGEPIVESPLDALKCFFNTEMDALALGSFLITKENQTASTIASFKHRRRAYEQD